MAWSKINEAVEKNIAYLCDIRNQNELTQQTLRSERAEILGMMATMQEVSVFLGLFGVPRLIDFFY